MLWKKAKRIHEVTFVKMRSLRVSVLKLQVLKIYNSFFFFKLNYLKNHCIQRLTGKNWEMYNCTVFIVYKPQNLGTAMVTFTFSWPCMSLAGDLDLNITAKDSMENHTYDIA